MAKSELMKACESFANDLVTFYALYCDSIRGFKHNAEERKQMLASGVTKPENKIWYGHSETSPGRIEITAIAFATQSEFVKQNEPGGLNHILAAHQFIATTFTSWEHKHRQTIANTLGIENMSDLKIDVLGDLRKLRHDILHHHGIVRAKTLSQLQELAIFCASDKRLELSEQNVFDLAVRILTALDNVVIDHTGEDPKMRKGKDLSGFIVS